MNKCHFLCFACKVINMDYGMKDQNPIDKVRFFCKGRSSKTITINEDQVVLSFPQLASEGRLLHSLPGKLFLQELWRGGGIHVLAGL